MLKVNELFSGIGSQTQALKNIGIEHKVVGIAEIDKFAIQSYEAIHGKTYNYGDISKVESLNYADLWTYSFPCTDVSICGKQEGLHGGTRSGLLYEVERLLKVSKDNNELPKYLLLENVKNLVGKKFKADFDNWLETLNELGYNNYWQVLNAKHYGIPQNRERVFVVSIKKDIDKSFEFPQPFDNGLRLKDFLEDEVDEKYYLSGSYLDWWNRNKEFQLKKQYSALNPDIAICQTARQYASWNGNYVTNEIKLIGLLEDINGHDILKRVYDSDGISPTLNTMNGGNRQPKILINKNECIQDDKQIELPCIYDDRDKGYGVKISNICPTQRSERSGIKCIEEDCRIRKLTPCECWKLMGFKKEEFIKVKEVGVSDHQLYRQAGNSIVINVLEEIFKKLLK